MTKKNFVEISKKCLIFPVSENKVALRFISPPVSKYVFFTGLLLFLFLHGFLCFSNDGEKQFFTKSFIEKIINNQDLLREAVASDALLFDKIKLDGLKIYDASTEVFLNTSIYQYYIDFISHNILLITEKVDGRAYVRDCLIIEKQNPEAYLANGPVEINGSYFDWDITVLVNHKWSANFTDDISQAFKINFETKKIESFSFNTIRLYSEV